MRNDRIQRLLEECRERQTRKARLRERRLKALERQVLEEIAYRQKVREKRAERTLKRKQEAIKEENQDLNLFRLCFDEEHLYTTREELYEREAKGDGKINWEAWNRIVKEFRDKNAVG